MTDGADHLLTKFVLATFDRCSEGEPLAFKVSIPLSSIVLQCTEPHRQDIAVHTVLAAMGVTQGFDSAFEYLWRVFGIAPVQLTYFDVVFMRLAHADVDLQCMSDIAGIAQRVQNYVEAPEAYTQYATECSTDMAYIYGSTLVPGATNNAWVDRVRRRDEALRFSRLHTFKDWGFMGYNTLKGF